MAIIIKGKVRDVIGFLRLKGNRLRRIRKASAKPLPVHSVNILSQNLHPHYQRVVIESVSQVSSDTRVFRFTPENDGKLAYFLSGQYINVYDETDSAGGKAIVSRPYSIAAAPNDNYYEIAIKLDPKGYFSTHIFENWSVGRKLVVSGPEGFFNYNELRDSKNIVMIAGGSGITPFRSMIEDILNAYPDSKITLFYGSRTEKDILFRDDFNKLESEYDRRFKSVYVLSEDSPGWKGETGFITSELIKKYVSEPKGGSYFICGPELLHKFADKELQGFNLPRRRVRRESYEFKGNPAECADYPVKINDKVFSIKVHVGDKLHKIKAKADESVLKAMELAGICPPSSCRTGECGYCRSHLISGKVYIAKKLNGLRLADRKFGYFHPCIAFPVSDIVMRVPRIVPIND